MPAQAFATTHYFTATFATSTASSTTFTASTAKHPLQLLLLLILLLITVCFTIYILWLTEVYRYSMQIQGTAQPVGLSQCGTGHGTNARNLTWGHALTSTPDIATAYWFYSIWSH